MTYDEIKSRFHDRITKDSGNSFLCSCPGHDDDKASLSIAKGDKDGVTVVKCFAGCEPAQILSPVGLTVNDLFSTNGTHNGMHNGTYNASRNGSANKKTPLKSDPVVATYEYKDASGKLVFRVQRKQSKAFVQSHPDDTGGWVYKMDGVNRVLYRLPEIVASGAETWVLIPEGEKDCDNLHKAGYIATTNAGGAKAPWLDAYSESLRGRKVCILPDNDDPGRQHADDVAKHLAGIAADVRLLELPGLPEKGDVSDWLAAGNDPKTLLPLVESAPFAIDMPADAPGEDAPETKQDTPKPPSSRADLIVKGIMAIATDGKLTPPERKKKIIDTLSAGIGKSERSKHQLIIDALVQANADFKNSSAEKFVRGCVADELRKQRNMEREAAEQRAASAKKKDDERVVNIATILYELAAANCETFTGNDGIVYASITITDKDGVDHTEVMKVKSMRFRQWLGQLFYKVNNTVVGKTACEEVIELMSYQSGDTRQTFLRVGQDGDNIYIDLGNDKWQCVEINAKGWQVLDKAPVSFRRNVKMSALPMPARVDDINAALLELWSLINIAQEDRVLVLAWLLSAMRAHGPYPIIALLAEAGSAKTTTAKALKRLVSPYIAETRSRPKTVEDVYVAANNDWILIYDNLSSIPQDISDAFCRLSTGGGYATRELYENLEEIATDQQRPLIINGISDIVKKGDLMSRVLTITCPEIAAERRIDESTWERKFADARPRIMGALYELLSAVLDNLPNVKLTELPRMADFAKLGTALDMATGIEGHDLSFAKRYSDNVSQGSITIIEQSPVYRPLYKLMQSNEKWEGTASELLEAIRPLAGSVEQFYLPKAGNHLSGAIGDISPNLRMAKIIDCHIGRNKHGRRISLARMKNFADFAPTDEYHDADKG